MEIRVHVLKASGFGYKARNRSARLATDASKKSPFWRHNRKLRKTINGARTVGKA